jgi:hypothetical protein
MPSSGARQPTLQQPWRTPPQLNPDEWVWNNVKADGVARAAPKGPEQMKAVVTARLRRLQRLPHIVRGFFADPELRYIAAAA